MKHEHGSAGFEAQPERYQKIEKLNHESFLMHEPSPLRVVQSLHSVGAPRDVITDGYNDEYPSDVVEQAKAIGRHIVVGNVSPLNGYGPRDMSGEEKVADAQHNIHEFLARHNVDPSTVRMLRPERDYTTPLRAVNVDEDNLQPDDTGLLRPDTAGDFLYTYNKDNVLAARPADCPIVFLSAETPKGDMTVLLHLAWQGVAHGYIAQAKSQLDALGVDWTTLRAQLPQVDTVRHLSLRTLISTTRLTSFQNLQVCLLMLKQIKPQTVLLLMTLVLTLRLRYTRSLLRHGAWTRISYFLTRVTPHHQL